MKSVTATQARSNLYSLIDQTDEESNPIYITGKRNNAILVSEKDWNAIQETLHLLSIPGMRESIIKGLKEPLEKTTSEIKW